MAATHPMPFDHALRTLLFAKFEFDRHHLTVQENSVSSVVDYDNNRRHKIHHLLLP